MIVKANQLLVLGGLLDFNSTEATCVQKEEQIVTDYLQTTIASKQPEDVFFKRIKGFSDSLEKCVLGFLRIAKLHKMSLLFISDSPDPALTTLTCIVRGILGSSFKTERGREGQEEKGGIPCEDKCHGSKKLPTGSVLLLRHACSVLWLTVKPMYSPQKGPTRQKHNDYFSFTRSRISTKVPLTCLLGSFWSSSLEMVAQLSRSTLKPTWTRTQNNGSLKVCSLMTTSDVITDEHRVTWQNKISG